MDVFSALQTAVSGLKAQSFSLSNISGNIANSQTTGYKRIDTGFVDMLVDSSNTRNQTAGSVGAFSELTNSIQGNKVSTGVSTNMALDGEGFFVVRKKTTDAGGSESFSTANLYTRRGDFAPDKDGYLVNGAGSYLVGASLDPVTGQTNGTGAIKISNAIIPAKPTTTITYSANLPKSPATTTAASSKGLLSAFSDGTDARVTPANGATGGTVSQSNAQSLIDNSVAGPALTVYTASGSPVSIQSRWAKVAAGDAATGTSDTWNLFIADKTSVAGNQTSWSNMGQAFTFSASGQLTAPTGSTVPINNLTVDGVNVGSVGLDISGGLTQYAAASGTVTTNDLKQNGYASGSLNSVEVGENGIISGKYSNGSVIGLARIEVAQFVNPDGLKPDSLGNYQQTVASGEAIIGLKDSAVVGANVEQSNTDIAAEFSKMIVTQQAYSANTRVMSTAQTMISDLLNVIR
ncbi:flagellar hook-basal body complex protein [Methylorubrum rhodesianum]|jgi:flagellar hook protein FlgE|uniref:Flagellar hook protein FlgE n=1 Tax=Methylorubrum rhodesianum TaxID=29427 RepID=A0ABU9Z755_9HYPH|nr:MULTISPECIES: flagellar hook-basal body complex protein [Methylorubrum]MBB5763679.1 flagellar hook protein FlgE [Methylorubrum rhodesianum]MBI1689770.1 flagellar hook-basal body complex protein [Methylorubrum sp. DB1722]MBK3402102.1 flagellar hook-basal body complex protein [Methylorubrum rhodesianum]MBY0140264.1 flagellar hook-basal body complex protein [Methylorubrum populi]